MKRFISTAFIALLLSSPLMAKRFTNQYCEFELPPGWECALEGTEYVCQSETKDRQRESIIILAAKIRGSEDSLDAYMAYLKKQKAFALPGGKTQVSEPKISKTTSINGQTWVDALHLASEVPGFYTRYLATTKEDLGVAVTLSVAKDHYESYQPVFDKIIASLRVFRDKQVQASDFKLKKTDENLLENSTFLPDGVAKNDISQKKKGGSGLFGDGSNDLYIIIGIVGLVLFIIIKRKGKKRK